MTSKGTLVVLSGPSGVGKGTIIKRLLQDCDNLELSVSATTRSPRNEDREGETYYFKTREEFEAMIRQDDFLEWAMYNNNYYGTPLRPVREKLEAGTHVLLEIDVQGALHVKQYFPDAVYIFLAPPDLETLHTRLRGRGTESEEEIARRIAAADAELAKQDEYDFVVINDVLDDAVSTIKEIIKTRSAEQ